MKMDTHFIIMELPAITHQLLSLYLNMFGVLSLKENSVFEEYKQEEEGRERCPFMQDRDCGTLVLLMFILSYLLITIYILHASK